MAAWSHSRFRHTCNTRSCESTATCKRFMRACKQAIPRTLESDSHCFPRRLQPHWLRRSPSKKRGNPQSASPDQPTTVCGSWFRQGKPQVDQQISMNWRSSEIGPSLSHPMSSKRQPKKSIRRSRRLGVPFSCPLLLTSPPTPDLALLCGRFTRRSNTRWSRDSSVP